MEHENTVSESVDCSLSPDITSPSQLQEVTLDQDASLSNTMGLRSPGGPFRGRTVKEYEDQLSSLRKENFNLKLRIYFLEEKMGSNFTLDKDTIVKKNINLQVEIANLQKEVQEKHELLCQAVKAIEIEEDEHQKASRVKDQEILQLQQDMENLRVQLQEHRESQLANFVYDKTDSLREQIDSLQNDCESKDQAIDSLNLELTSANERLVEFAKQFKDYQEKLAGQHSKNVSLASKLQEEQKAKDKLKLQLDKVTEKLAMEQFDREQDTKDFERERNQLQRNNTILGMRITSLESENSKQKDALREQQVKLEATVAEVKKHQTLAVPMSNDGKPESLSTDGHFISVARPAAADRAAKESPLHVQIEKGARMARSPSKMQSPPTPDNNNLLNFEKLLLDGCDNDLVSSEFAIVKQDFAMQKQKIIKLKSEQLKACAIIKSMIDFRNKANEEIIELKKTNENLTRELESVVSKPNNVVDCTSPLRTRVSEMHITAVGTPQTEKPAKMAEQQHELELEMVLEQYKQLTTELEAKIEVLVQTLEEKDLQMDYVRNQYEEIVTTLELKENKIVDLEFDLLSTEGSFNRSIDRSAMEKGDAGTEKRSSFYKHELEEKTQEIERLNGELKQCTCYLQEIVNKELWEKNREIEKLHLRQENTPQLIKLKKELTGKDMQLKVLKEKINELGLDIKLPDEETFDMLNSPNKNIEHIKLLQDKLKTVKEERDYFEKRVNEFENTSIDKLKIENTEIRAKLDKSEQLRHGLVDVCTVLGNRLGELAVFMKSLVTQSVLDFLGSAKNNRLREIVSESLDMSRSFTMSLMVNPEQSLAQLSNITPLLEGSVYQELSLVDDLTDQEEVFYKIVSDNASLTYEPDFDRISNSDRPFHQHVILALREQVFKLKKELQVRDIELNRLNSGQTNKESGVERLSDSEADGNPLLKVTPKKVYKGLFKEVQSESEAWSEPDRDVSRARIGLNVSQPPASKLQLCESTEDDDLFGGLTPSKRRSALIELNQDVQRLQHEVEEKSEEIIANNVMYRQKLQEMDRELQEEREKLEHAELEKINVLQKVENLQKVIDDLNVSKKQMEDSLIGKDKEMQDKINRVELEKTQLLAQSHEYIQQLNDANNQVTVTQEKLKSLEEHSIELEKQLRTEYEQTLITKLRNAEEMFLTKIKAVEEKCDAEIKIAQEGFKLAREEYAKDYIKKQEVEEKLAETERVMSELADAKARVQLYEDKIKSYKEAEKNVNNVIQHHMAKISSLQVWSEQQASRNLELEKENSKLTEEKNKLDEEIDTCVAKEHDIRNELQRIQSEVERVTEKYNEQLSSLHKQKGALELKISELENANADLYNRLIKAQTGKFNLELNATMPNNFGSNRPFYRRQGSDQNTYSSEEFEDFRGRAPQLQPSVQEVERAEANSSPDLGIESDQGKFSSLETNGNPQPHRPLLRTIQITASMNNLFESHNVDEEQQNQPPTDCDHHCCSKSMTVAQENYELKRKLQRMKRALEETATQLNLANQRKKQVEKTICKQIHKTSQVLRKAKANLDSGSETDFRM